MDNDQLLQLAGTRFEQERARIASLAPQNLEPSDAAPAADPPATFQYWGYLDVEGAYWFHMDVIGMSSSDVSFHGSGESWIVGVGQCEVGGQMSQQINQLDGAKVNFTLTLGTVGPGGGAEINFYLASDGSLLT